MSSNPHHEIWQQQFEAEISEKSKQVTANGATILRDNERLFWLGVRQGLLTFLAAIEKYKLKLSRSCKHCGKAL